MSKLPVLSGRDLVRALEKAGFQLDRQKGSQMILYRAEPPATISVPDLRQLALTSTWTELRSRSAW